MEWGLDVGAVAKAGEKGWIRGGLEAGGRDKGLACVFEMYGMRGFEGLQGRLRESVCIRISRLLNLLT